MKLNDRISTFWNVLALLLFANAAKSAINDPKFHASLNSFSQNLFHQLYQTNGKENLIFSPFSIQTCLAMVRMGADGPTAVEMDQGLNFTGQSIDGIAKNYNALLGQYEDGKILKIANKVYVMKDFSLQNEYKEILSQKFYSSAESMDFEKSEEAAKTINSWVASKTDDAIEELVEPMDLSSDTRLMLLSAIYFKGDWEKPFDAKNTKEEEFFVDEDQSIKVQMMYRAGMIDYSKIEELDATAVRLPYKDSDLSMVIILPNARNGLAAMEAKLETMSLTLLSEKLNRARGTRLYLPKFKVEFTVNLNAALIKMGMKQMFSQANLGKMLQQHEPLQVSDVVHKAIIDVNEWGTTAAGITRAGIMTRTRAMIFRADHPFYYVIMNADTVPLFQGTFVGA
ncbi:serine protease inhibitor 42Dd [Stomoxys calcitrans]|uniref:serine protease inhibitor 42Dd n=1 Tax=Stomoxys calcitrans TaxID=35570 RepID=UPI0027E31173|nr:serine protease inhibitor 42Dd [Stomoxys calcitrans]